MKPLLVVFSGAGLSAESGVPTFRDSQGLWENHRIEDVATPEGWQKDPTRVLAFYAKRFETMQTVTPNHGHRTLAAWEAHFEIIHLTQNIDPLLERAGCSKVIHLHGEIQNAKCERHYDIFLTPKAQSCDYKTAIRTPIQFGMRCPKCGGQLRPDVVWFGEAVALDAHHLPLLRERAAGFMVIGTSAQVYPAASLIPFFSGVPSKYYLDPAPSPLAHSGFRIITGKAAEMLPKLTDILREELKVAL